MGAAYGLPARPASGAAPPAHADGSLHRTQTAAWIPARDEGGGQTHRRVLTDGRLSKPTRKRGGGGGRDED